MCGALMLFFDCGICSEGALAPLLTTKVRIMLPHGYCGICWMTVMGVGISCPGIIESDAASYNDWANVDVVFVFISFRAIRLAAAGS